MSLSNITPLTSRVHRSCSLNFPPTWNIAHHLGAVSTCLSVPPSNWPLNRGGENDIGSLWWVVSVWLVLWVAFGNVDPGLTNPCLSIYGVFLFCNSGLNPHSNHNQGHPFVLLRGPKGVDHPESPQPGTPPISTLGLNKSGLNMSHNQNPGR